MAGNRRELLRILELPPGFLGTADRAAFRVLIGRLDGVPVAAAMTCDHGGDCGIYNVGTVATAALARVGNGLLVAIDDAIAQLDGVAGQPDHALDDVHVVARAADVLLVSGVDRRTRLVALFHVASVDTQIATSDAKYAYLRWRPVTAIVEAQHSLRDADIVRKLAAVLPVDESDLMRAAQEAAGYRVREDAVVDPVGYVLDAVQAFYGNASIDQGQRDKVTASILRTIADHM